MENIILSQANNAVVPVTAVAAVKVAGPAVSRSLHTTPMRSTSLRMKTTSKTSSKSIQTMKYSSKVAPCITNDAAAKSEIDVEGWIKKHYTPYEGDASFLSGPTEKTKKLFSKAKNT